MSRRPRKIALCAAAAALLALPSHASAFDPLLEVKNFAKTTERYTQVVLKPDFLLRLEQQSLAAPLQAVQIIANDPERLFANVCAIRARECAGDIRFYEWEQRGSGVRTPVVFTARSGATISGTVWGTNAGPAQRPGVVITTGSVQAPEVLYWGLAALLAKHGYVVLTYDVQGQGQSDTLGEAPDTLESVPAQGGQPFYDGTEDALDFLLSTPANPYDPRPSCGNGLGAGNVGTDHSPKHDRRVGAGLATGFNPMHALVDDSRIGIAGHSLGAAAVSYVGQADPRVDALVAWDNLDFPADDDSDTRPDGVPTCPSAPATRDTVPPNAKPALGISNDYGIAPAPFLSDPNPQEKVAAFERFAAQGTDSMELVIRGGTHEESALVPGTTVPPLGLASWRGQDLIGWYTTAWLDKYVKGDPGADARVLSDRWCDDDLSQGVDLNNDGNMFSFYFRSKRDITLSGGGGSTSADIRAECPSSPADPDYDYLADANTPDSSTPPSGDADGDGVPDPDDACPSAPGPPGTSNGCPSVPASASREEIRCPSVTPLRGTKRGDRLTGTDGVDRIIGLRGRDRIDGRGGADCLAGGRGRDRITGGAGVDTIRAGSGADVINARDGSGDEVRCGKGRDKVRADAADVLLGCERVRRAGR